MTAYRWIGVTSIMMCLLTISVVFLGKARDIRELSERGLTRTALSKERRAVNQLTMKALREVEVARLVGLAREAWLVSRGVLTRVPDDRPAGKFL